MRPVRCPAPTSNIASMVLSTSTFMFTTGYRPDHDRWRTLTGLDCLKQAQPEEDEIPAAAPKSDNARRRQERRTADRRASNERWLTILEGAAVVFRRQGYSRARLEDVAAEVGINRASLYYYVGTKEELLIALIEGPAYEMTQHCREALQADLPADEKLRQGAACLHRRSAEPPRTVPALQRESAHCHDPGSGQTDRGQRRRLRQDAACDHQRGCQDRGLPFRPRSSTRDARHSGYAQLDSPLVRARAAATRWTRSAKSSLRWCCPRAGLVCTRFDHEGDTDRRLRARPGSTAKVPLPEHHRRRRRPAHLSPGSSPRWFPPRCRGLRRPERSTHRNGPRRASHP